MNSVILHIFKPCNDDAFSSCACGVKYDFLQTTLQIGVFLYNVVFILS